MWRLFWVKRDGAGARTRSEPWWLRHLPTARRSTALRAGITSVEACCLAGANNIARRWVLLPTSTPIRLRPLRLKLVRHPADAGGSATRRGSSRRYALRVAEQIGRIIGGLDGLETGEIRPPVSFRKVLFADIKVAVIEIGGTRPGRPQSRIDGGYICKAPAQVGVRRPLRVVL